MAQIREITQFGRIEYEMFKTQGRFDLPAPERCVAHVRETAMRDFGAMAADPKSEINVKLGGIKNISRIRVYMLEPNEKMQFPLRLEFILIKPLGMIEEERLEAAKKAAREVKQTERRAKDEKTKGSPKRPNKPTDPKKAKFAKGKKGPRRPRQDDDETPFKPAELTGRVVPVQRVVLPQRRYH